MGGYLLARGRNLAPPLSLMVAFVAALNGWIICWGATDWFGALGAFAWLPWAWWGMERALDPKRSPLAFSLARAIRLPRHHRRFPLHGPDARTGRNLAWI
jgi:hypothetical protein